MNAFVRQLAVLSVLWALCELLLPEGRQQRMARLTVSVLVMAALLSALSALLGQPVRLEKPAWTELPSAQGETYSRIALRSAANQAKAFCERVALGAGYDAEAEVFLRLDGSLEHVILRLTAHDHPPPSMTMADIAHLIADRLQTEPSRVVLEYETDGAVE